MDDRTLLERAAKAAGVAPILCYETRRNCLRIGSRGKYVLWRPLTDDGDALRLAVKRGLSLHVFHSGPIFVGQSMTSCLDLEIEEDGKSDPYAATRRAIVKAAAALAGD